MAKEKREFTPMMAQTPDGTKIKCKDCKYRDKTTITVNGKTIPVGITKGNCELFPYPENKPGEILFLNADCGFYEKE